MLIDSGDAVVATWLPPTWRLLIAVGLFGGLAVVILAGHGIAHWWRRSPTVFWLRWHLTYVRARLAYLFRRLRKRPVDPIEDVR